MKKNFLLAMVVMLMTAVSSFAQKEYNMVITLSNGTTVTLGHNDIKEITFNDGEVAISGNMVNTIDSLAQVSQNLEYQIRTVEERSMKMSYDLFNRTEELYKQIAETDTKVANTEAALQNTYNLVKEQSDKINILNEKIADLEALIAKYHSEESK